MAYWTDIFTPETWAQAESQAFLVSGFPAPTPRQGGYSVKMFSRVGPGDVLLCYCKRPVQRWVGALSVTSTVFQSSEPVWGLTESGEPRFPWRFSTEPIVALDPERGAPGEEVAQQVGFLKRLRFWGNFLQRSLNSVPEEDGAVLLKILQEPREPLPIAVPKRRGEAGRRDTASVELTLLDARATAPRSEVEPEPVVPEGEHPRVHTEIQGRLRDIGVFEGYDVWVADRGLEWEGTPLGEGCLERLPIIAPEQTLRVMRNIDVIWFRKGTGHPYHFFEVEHSTSVYSGLLRFNDVMIDFPIPKAFIVGDEKTYAKFEREMARRTFEYSGLREVTYFLPYADVRETWARFRELGSGSRAWGARPHGSRGEGIGRGTS